MIIIYYNYYVIIKKNKDLNTPHFKLSLFDDRWIKHWLI